MGQKTKSHTGEQEKVHIYGKSCGKMWKDIYNLKKLYLLAALLILC